METSVAVWFAGGLLAALAYLGLVVRPEYHEHAPHSGLLIAAFHFGPRVAAVFVLWPLLAVVGLSVWLGERGQR